MSEIIWPESHLPGYTDFYVSNETVVANLNAAEVWPFLTNTSHWPIVYAELAQVRFHDNSGPELGLGARFEFVVGGTLVQAEINEFDAPSPTTPGRLAWHGWIELDGKKLVDAHCGWLIENLSGDRVRVVWQESLIGPAAQGLAAQRPNLAVSSHQEWVDGIPAAALAARSPVGA